MEKLFIDAGLNGVIMNSANICIFFYMNKFIIYYYYFATLKLLLLRS